MAISTDCKVLVVLNKVLLNKAVPVDARNVVEDIVQFGSHVP